MIKPVSLPFEYLVLDLECDNELKDKGSKIPRAYANNPIVAHGLLHSCMDDILCLESKDVDNKFYEELLSVTNCVIGANLKYDIQYLRRDFPAWLDWFRNPDSMVWDVQTVEYLLTGQQHKMANLNDLSLKYGGTLKNDVVKEMWENGTFTREIPWKILKPYLYDDVLNTYTVYIAQVNKARKMNMFPLIESQMDAYLGIAEMEWNGIYFNKEAAEKEIEKQEEEFKIYKEKIEKALGNIFCTPDPLSNKQISLYLFGGEWVEEYGTEPYMKDGEAQKYKTGLKKGEYKRKKAKIKYKDIGILIPDEEWKNKTGLYKVDVDTLNTLITPDRNRFHSYVDTPMAQSTIQFMKDLLSLRTIQKDMSTYFKGYSDLCFDDNIIHHNLNTCNTNTGRLSCTKPNMQNVSK